MRGRAAQLRSLNARPAALQQNLSSDSALLFQVALLRGGWNELLIAGFAHRSVGIQNGEESLNTELSVVICLS